MKVLLDDGKEITSDYPGVRAFEFSFMDYDEEALNHEWVNADQPWDIEGHKPVYRTVYHGLKAQGLYSFLCSTTKRGGGLEASSDPSLGQRIILSICRSFPLMSLYYR